MAKMAGPFLPLPGEVIKLLKGESNACFKYYILMVAECFLEADEDAAGEWVGAYVYQSKRQIMEKTGASSSWEVSLFPRWEQIGLVEMRDGLVYVTKSYKKGDDYFKERLLKQDLSDLKKSHISVVGKQTEMEATVVEMSETISNLLGLLANKESEVAAPVPGEAASMGAVSAPGEGLASALVRPEMIDTTKRIKDTMISIFYKSIGQARVSASVRSKGQIIFKSLLEEGFSPYEIGLAIDWTTDPTNTNQKIRSFGIIKSTISQAMQALEAQKEREVVVQEREQAEDTAVIERKAEGEMRERLELVKGAMSDDDRAELASKALAQLRGMGVYQESMITQILVSIQENQILREIEDLKDSTDLAGE